MANFLSQALNITRLVIGEAARGSRQFSAITNIGINQAQSTANANAWSLISVRERMTFRPSETKRVKKLGFWARMKTRAGRRVIMRRILKGRYYLAH